MRRYEQMPDTRAQLINGTVVIRGDVPFTHGEAHASITGWLGSYAARHPHLIAGSGLSAGTLVSDKAARHPHLIAGSGSTTLLSDLNVFEPDVLLMRPESAGGSARIGVDGYVHGPPELIIEVAASTASLDANAKAEAYHAAGVGEYLLWRTEEERIDWYEHTDDRYLAMTPDAEGLVESNLFPGLILDPAALLRGDLATVLGHVTS